MSALLGFVLFLGGTFALDRQVSPRNAPVCDFAFLDGFLLGGAAALALGVAIWL